MDAGEGAGTEVVGWSGSIGPVCREKASHNSMSACRRSPKFRARSAARLCVMLVALLLPFGCNSKGVCERKETLRVTSPDERTDAVLIRTNCGATTGYSYNAYIVPKKGRVEKADPVFVADKLEGEALEWEAPKQLRITYRAARIFHFTNYWQSRDMDDFKYVVTIREAPLLEGPQSAAFSAPGRSKGGHLP